ncbi:alginate lyase [Polaribacter pectinis]|uniref:Alginate lyase n=1 Tax=Polaribacter pectinis TaxID=2738844 RepID=A0A7G9L9K5_9FLAO|nr:chondroitinase-B domain-containing protein [Polaribacter pectinis]QNM85304.1 alginate lyase [Polaribacter pectinis]
MKNLFLTFNLLFLLISCNKEITNSVFVKNSSELNDAIKNAKPGDDIVLKDGVWKDVEIEFSAKGTKDNLITLRAETPGKVFIEGVSNLSFGGEYLVVSGLHFRNGYSPTVNVIAFRTDKNNVANNCRVTNCVIVDFNKLERDNDDLWVQFYGRHNQLDHCYLAGKTNGGPTVRVDLKGIESIKNYHKITNNHFGPRPRKGGARGETIQLGSSFTSMSPSNTTIANNFFEECNGEVEIISSKTNFNEIKNNVFYKSEGSVVTRHGNYTMIDGNYFIGDGENENYGGIRIVNTGHWIVNNYFYKIIGENFRSPLAVMNGIPKSPLNRYNQVTDVVVAYNTYVDCKSPFQFGVGTNIAQSAVLPKSEIRSARPIRTTVANNVIYNSVEDKNVIVEHDKADGVLFKSNVINNNGADFKDSKRIKSANFDLNKISDNIMLPNISSVDVKPYNGFDFDLIKTDLAGNSREKNNAIGATVKADITNPNILDRSKYGATWFKVDAIVEGKTIKVSASDNLSEKINSANKGDIISLDAGKYIISKSLIIDKNITVQSASENKAEIVFEGAENTPAFSLNPYGILTLKNVKLSGNGKNQAFASLKEKMSNHFGLSVSDSEISNFNYVLKAYKQTFAETVTFKNTSISNCENGIELSEETNDRGDYNTEFLTIDNCTFNNVKQNVIDYYRGGYDESTIGGNLLVTNSTFTNCGAKEKNKMLLNHRGIVNVDINNNTFKNNKVQFVSILWGAKNNVESNNTLINSGKINTEENLVMKLMY